MSRGERFRRLGRATAAAPGETADLFEHFGLPPRAGAASAAPDPSPIEPRPAAPCRRCGWLCVANAVAGPVEPCPNCGLAPRVVPMDAP